MIRVQIPAPPARARLVPRWRLYRNPLTGWWHAQCPYDSHHCACASFPGFTLGEVMDAVAAVERAS